MNEIDELLEDLSDEYEVCNSCPCKVNFGNDYCGGCGTYGNIQDHEELIRSLTESE